MTHLQRIRRMDGREIRWRSRVAARIGLQRLRSQLQTPHWHREDIARILAAGVLDAAADDAAARHDWMTVHDSLAKRIAGRAPRFLLDVAAADEMRAAILTRWPDAERQAAASGDRILGGCYDLLGYRGLEFGVDGSVDWHRDPVHGRHAPPTTFWADVPYLDPALGDHKIIWELNRHQHWLMLGRAYWLTRDSRYRRRILTELESWLRVNPPLTGINWASMLEIGFRSISWVWALHFLITEGHAAPEDGGPWLVDMLVGLHHQLTHVEQNLSYYFSPNTHLSGEALALYAAGTALPELAASARWAALGRQILTQEIDRQILPDGGHAERSTHYQRYTLDFYLMALLTARRAADASAAATFADACARLAGFTRAIADDTGRLPLIGDDDGGMLWPLTGRDCADVRDSLALAGFALADESLAAWGVPEEVCWLAGADAATWALQRRPGSSEVSCTKPDTGYAIVRDGRGSHAVFDGGAHGYLNAGHAHADALALTLMLRGRSLLIDPGTSTYTMDRRLRDRMRSSERHNTLTIDGLSAAEPSGPFHWRRRADGQLQRWRHNAAFDWVEASHDGYAPLVHSRGVLRTARGGWFIVDTVTGLGAHRGDAHWHFDPAWMVAEHGPGQVRAVHFDGTAAWLLFDRSDIRLAHGDEETGLGWYAPVYGTLVPTWTARVSTSGEAPWSTVTWIGQSEGHPELRRLMLDGGDDAGAAVHVADGCLTSLFVVRTGATSHVDCHDVRGACGYRTDARMLHCSHQHGRLESLALVDATHALALGGGYLSVSADGTMSDLHVMLRGETLDLMASSAPSQLRLHGEGLRMVRAVNLNGLALPLSGETGSDGLLINAAAWGTPRGTHAPGAAKTGRAASALPI